MQLTRSKWESDIEEGSQRQHAQSYHLHHWNLMIQSSLKPKIEEEEAGESTTNGESRSWQKCQSNLQTQGYKIRTYNEFSRNLTVTRRSIKHSSSSRRDETTRSIDRSQLTRSKQESDIMKVVSQKVQSKDLVLNPIINFNTNLTEDIIQHRFSPMFENLKSTRKKLGNQTTNRESRS